MKKKPKPQGVRADTRKRIFLAARMAAEGRTNADIGKAFGLSNQAVTAWRRVEPYRALWERAYDEAMQTIAAEIREAAGTDAVFSDPDKHLKVATRADRWLTEKGEQLFPVNSEPTVCSFFNDFYLPTCMFDAKPASVQQYEIVLRKWQYLTGDPSLKNVTVGVLSKFRDALAKCRGKKPHLPASPRTVRNGLRMVQTLLDKAGPAGPRNRDAAGILDSVPWVRPPRIVQTPRSIVPDQLLADVYQAAVAMDSPKLYGFKPAAWWRALLVTAYYTGLRRGTLLRLRMEDIDWKSGRLVIGGDRMKAGRVHAMPLHPVALEHLRRIRTDRELVFEWPYRVNRFHVHLHKLQDAAGIPKKNHFGLQTLRRTLGTNLYAVSPSAAQLGLGHRNMDTTVNHYIRKDDIVSEAVAKLPDPFGQGGDN